MEINTKYDLGNVVKTPLSIAVITEIKIDAGGTSYYTVNTVEGVSDRWWHERFLSDPPPPEKEA